MITDTKNGLHGTPDTSETMPEDQPIFSMDQDRQTLNAIATEVGTINGKLDTVEKTVAEIKEQLRNDVVGVKEYDEYKKGAQDRHRAETEHRKALETRVTTIEGNENKRRFALYTALIGAAISTVAAIITAAFAAGFGG